MLLPLSHAKRKLSTSSIGTVTSTADINSSTDFDGAMKLQQQLPPQDQQPVQFGNSPSTNNDAGSNAQPAATAGDVKYAHAFSNFTFDAATYSHATPNSNSEKSSSASATTIRSRSSFSGPSGTGTGHNRGRSGSVQIVESVEEHPEQQRESATSPQQLQNAVESAANASDADIVANMLAPTPTASTNNRLLMTNTKPQQQQSLQLHTGSAVPPKNDASKSGSSSLINAPNNTSTSKQQVGPQEV